MHKTRERDRLLSFAGARSSTRFVDLTAFAAAAAIALATGSAAELAWAPGFNAGGGPSGPVSALAEFDDGGGSALYAGGDFDCAGEVLVNGVARWDGSTWSALRGPQGTGTDGKVRSLLVFDDGSGPALYVGGDFVTAGGVTVNGIARWDGFEWSALAGSGGTGVGGPYPYVTALAVFDDGSGPALYAGGSFETAGGATAHGVARWNGSAWSPLIGPGGAGVGGHAYALAIHDDGDGSALYIGGIFASAGGVTANNVARWDGGTWSALTGPSGTGTDAWVQALGVFDDGDGPALYLGGNFNAAGGVTVNHIARWREGSWSPLSGPEGTGVGGDVSALAVFDDGSGSALYVGGGFAEAGGVEADSIARWTGETWSSVGQGANSYVYALFPFDEGAAHLLIAGGSFTTAGGDEAPRVAAWDGNAWSAVSEPAGLGVGGHVYVLAEYDDGSGPALYAGGSFVTAGGVTANNIARLDGGGWSPLGGGAEAGTDGYVRAMAVYDDGSGPALYIGGYFTSAGGVTVNRIARWDGATWSALAGPSGIGTSAAVGALAVFDDGSGPGLYAGGAFLTAGGLTVNHVARWDGNGWTALGDASNPGLPGPVTAFAVYDATLFAGGHYSSFGDLAYWNGAGWSSFGTGAAYHSVYTLAVHDDGSGPGLYLGGTFASAGGVTVNNVVRWDTSGTWSALPGPTAVGTNDAVHALAVFDDGSGPALYVGGEFTTAGGVVTNGVARWDDGGWSTLSGPFGTGIGGSGYAYSPVVSTFLGRVDQILGPALYAGGRFRWAGGLAAADLAEWTSRADLFADGFRSGDTSAWSYAVP